MATRQNRKHQGLAVQLSETLSAAALVLIPFVAWAFLIQRFGWWAGFVLGWVLGPLAGIAGATLALVWTIPLRPTDILSLRSRLDDPVPKREGPPPPPATISVIMPVHNAEAYLIKSLPPLVDMLRRGDLAEVMVVNDKSTDGSAAVAAGFGATVMEAETRGGPALARNIAARKAVGDILWFIDADVVVRPDGAAAVRTALEAPDVVAVFGSYDDSPPAKNFGSQYKNLVHHHYHQHGAPNASTFWSGCGAVEKNAFIAAGGFDGVVYGRPSIEDVDLGYRLRASGGRIKLDRNFLGTHLKVWSIPDLIKTDIFRRAIPWARLMMKNSEVLDDLNVGTVERLRAACAGLTVLAALAAIVGLISPWWLLPVLFTNLTANWHLFRLFYRTGGPFFGVAGLAFHQFYYLYSAAAFTWCWLESKFSPQRA